MKILGHVYVALKSVPNHNEPLLVWGSILPEMMFYIEENPFSYEEIHEGGETVLNFLRKEKPQWEGLALGLIAHSKGKGADRFDEFDKLPLLGYERGKNTAFEKLVGEATNIKNPNIIQARIHNVLDLALDYYILTKYPSNLNELKNAFAQVPISEMAGLLASCFEKDKTTAEKAIYKLKEKINPDDLTSIGGLARMWASFSSALSEKQPVNIPKTQEAIRKAVEKIQGKEEAFLETVVTWTKKNLTSLL